MIQALIAIPGALIGLAISYFWGARMDRAAGIDHGFTRAGPALAGPFRPGSHPSIHGMR